MVAIDIDDPVEEITELVLKERYSRIPVYRDNIDKIIGVLHTRDYLEALIIIMKSQILSYASTCTFYL